MPSQVFNYYSDEDIAAIVAYAKSVSPVDNELPQRRLGPLGRALFTAGIMAEYGEYIAGRGCADCHGANYAGGAVPGSPPDAPPAPNLTPAGNLASWSEADFIATIRSGFAPEGRQLDSKEMPWPTYSRLTDEELQALWLFLQSLRAEQS